MGNQIIVNGEKHRVYSIKTRDETSARIILDFENEDLLNLVRIRNLNWYKHEIEINDLIFLVLGGDRKPWNNGLIAVGKVYYIDYLEKSTKNYEIDVEIMWKLPAEMTPDDFYSFPDVKNAPNIGPSLNGTPNQAIGKITQGATLSIFAALNNVFDNSQDRIIELLGRDNFEKIFDVPRLSVIENRSDFEDNIASDLLVSHDTKSKEDITKFSQTEIRIDKNQFSIFELERKYKKGNLNLDSDFQRLDVWTNTQRSELIESVLIGLPIPIFYFNESRSGELLVVDGRQRLTSFIKFLNNEFALNNLKILREYNDLKFSELNSLLQSRIEDYQIQSYNILPPTHESVKFHIFDRVNRAGTQLNKQEIRNALYNGNITALLKEVVSTELFKKATMNYFVKDNRMKDRYILLRYLAFDYYFIAKKHGYDYTDIDTLLANAMSYFNQIPLEELSKYREKITRGLENSIYYLEGEAFINLNHDSKIINMNIFESQMYYFSQLEKREDMIDIVKEQMKNLFYNEDFIDSIGSYRDSKNKVEKRFEVIENLLRGLK